MNTRHRYIALGTVCAAATIATAAWYASRDVPDERFDAARTALADGPEGWRQLRDLAVALRDDQGELLRVQTLIVRSSSATPTVYFIPTRDVPEHYEFAHAALRADALAFTRRTFELATYGPYRRNLANSLSWRPRSATSADPGDPDARVILTFPAGDRPTADDITAAWRVLADALPHTEPGQREYSLVYAPSSDRQRAYLLPITPTLSASGVAWETVQSEALLEPNSRSAQTSGHFEVMQPGTAFGRLRFVRDSDELEDLGVQDIVLLEELPLDLPPVAGVITEVPQTPLSHVNVLARARRTPDLVLADARKDPRVAPFLGELVRFEVRDDGFAIEPATADEVAAYWEQRLPDQRTLPPIDDSVHEIADLDHLGFTDAAAYGAKAANLAELHRLLPDLTPGGLAVPFSAFEAQRRLWTVGAAECDALTGGCEPEGDAGSSCARAIDFCIGFLGYGARSVADYQAAMLQDTGFQSDSEARSILLDGFRSVIEDEPLEPTFAAELTEAARKKFGEIPFRMRSSANQEDLVGFTGAGLYESVTATIWDQDRLLTDRIQRVWASLWTWRAHEERTWWGIPHDRGRMGVLLNRSFPDEEANGVIVTANLAAPETDGLTINVQQGETSITNPEGGELPEIIVVARDGKNWERETLQLSSLSPDRSILTDAELAVLADAATTAHDHFAALYRESGLTGTDGPGAFELEFKVHGADRRIYLKQIRPFPLQVERDL